MRKLIALGLSAATLLVLPTAAGARDRDRDNGNWNRDRGGRDSSYRDDRRSGQRYNNYAYAYPRYSSGYYGGYGGRRYNRW